ncbi:MAG: hypothetical protein ABIS07_17445 [Dokdonella sp.]
MLSRLLISFLLLATCTTVTAANATSPALPPASPHYVDVYEYFTVDAQYEAWFSLTSQLRRDFDDICGDTFCEGDYGNIQSLDFRCSVEQTSGRIGRCLWIFAGSYEEIDADSGKINVTSHVWRCRAPLAPHTTMNALLAALAGNAPLRANLPGTSTSIYDGLTDCL